MRRLDGRKTGEVMREVLSARGVIADSVEHVASSLVQTSLRGVDSHGIHLFPHYCRAVDSGRINKAPRFRFEDSSPTTTVLDADDGFGHHAGAAAIDHAVARARTSGMAAVAVKASTHFGAAAYFGLRAAAKNCLGIAMTNADALIKAHGSKEAFTGTNPICFTAPIDGEEPFCLDMATSFVSWNKILNHRRTGEPLPPDWAYDADGQLVTDPNAARTLAPAGQFKGYGLSLMVDILCALLSGGKTSKDLLPMYQHIEVRRKISHFFLVIDIEKFSDAKAFALRMRELVERARALPATDPSEQVMVSGDPEKKTFALRSREGIPIDELKLQEMIATSARFAEALM
jgi:ureidoglycolate dehydrogenase (NAD+)